MKEHSISFISGLAGVIVATIAQYFINYHFIEQPKIELEKKKVALEAQRQVLSLVPQIESSCGSTRLDTWTWRIDCHSTNKGQYPVIVAIEKTIILIATDHFGIPYDAGSGFKAVFPNNKNMFMATAGTSGGDLYFYLQFDKGVHPFGIVRTDIVAQVEFSYKSDDSAIRFVNESFPDVHEMLTKFSSKGAFVRATPVEKSPTSLLMPSNSSAHSLRLNPTDHIQPY